MDSLSPSKHSPSKLNLNLHQSEPEIVFAQSDENDEALFVVLNEPALPNWMGSCHPNGSLYEKPLDLKLAQSEHANFRRELEKYGCMVMTVREILAKDVETDIVARVKLEDLAKRSLTYKLVGDQSELTNTEQFLISEKYKKEVIENMDVNQLVEVVLTLPTISLKKADKDTELTVVNYSYAPLSNLVFCRDQQLTTAKGVVMARPRNHLRVREVEVMKFCFDKLKVPVVGRVHFPGTLEGGDFFPAGRDLCLVGVGLRSNISAVRQMMEQDLFGTRRVAVVKDYFDQSQQRMHLDTMFNIISPKACIILAPTVGETSAQRRLVDEYVRGSDGIYRLERHDLEFAQFLRGEGYNLIELSDEMQYAYGCNGLNLGKSTMITVDKTTAKHLARSEHFTGRIIMVDFRNITNMYGSVHCCSQVIARKDLSKVDLSTRIDMAYKLCKAASSNSVLQIRDLLLSGADINALDYDKRSALHVASRDGHIEVVKFLVENGAFVNMQDSWGRTPLEDAEYCEHKEVAEYLRKHGGATSKELSNKKATEMMSSDSPLVARQLSIHGLKIHNSCSAAIMVAPTNFSVDVHSASDNAFMRNAEAIMDKMVKELKEGKRGVYHKILQEFAHLHKVLTVDLGLEIFLFTHQSYEKIPDAVFVRDWFSTHPGTETPAPTVVLYAMRAPSRRLEKRDELVTFLTGRYKNVINLAPLERGEVNAWDRFDLGKIRYTDTTEVETPLCHCLGPARLLTVGRSGAHQGKEFYACTHSPFWCNFFTWADPTDKSDPHLDAYSLIQSDGAESPATARHCKPIESSSFTTDRITKTAFYASPSPRLNEQAMELWGKRMGYKLYKFRLDESALNGKHIHHTRAMLYIGTNFVLVCTEIVAQPERAALVSALSNNGQKVVIEVSLGQTLNFAAYSAQEILDRNKKLILLMSTRAKSAFTPDQLAKLEKSVSKIIDVDMELIESLGGGSVSGLIGELY